MRLGIGGDGEQFERLTQGGQMFAYLIGALFLAIAISSARRDRQ